MGQPICWHINLDFKMNLGKYIYYVILVLGLSGCDGCKKDKPIKKPPDPPIGIKLVETPDFNKDSAYFFIKKQVEFGPRVPGTSAHTKTAAWLLEKLKSYAGDGNAFAQPARVQLFDGSYINISNIIATINPDAKKRILLCAHWDSRMFSDHDADPALHDKPVDGANDGGSGVGILL